MSEYSETSLKKGRGRAQRSLDLIEAMYDAAEAAQPITGRGIGYKLFTAGLIPSMSRNDMQRVYRLLKEAREEAISPGIGSSMKRASLSGFQPGATPSSTLVALPDPIAAISGTSSPSVAKYGARRAPCAACLVQC
jgi:hypothetical protein